MHSIVKYVFFVLYKDRFMEKVLHKQMKYQRVLIVTILVAFGLAGCTKKGVAPDPSDKFAGTWHMMGSCVGPTGTGIMFFGKGSGKNTITYSFSASGSNGSNNDCLQAKTITGTVEGNTATFPSTTLTDGCGTSYTVDAVATISKDDVITFTFNTSRWIGGSCTAVGTKTKQL